MSVSIHPSFDRRRFERYSICLETRVRRSNSSAFSVLTLTDIAEGGFQAAGYEPFNIGSDILVYLPGIAPKAAHVIWQEDGKTGAAFIDPLHVAVVDHIAKNYALP